jgi:tellurium resistance protein TerD
MSVSLTKNKSLSLSKDSKLKEIQICLGWDVGERENFDLDASLFMVNSKGIVNSEKDFVFYNNPDSSCKSVHHTGDNRTGGGDDDDDEVIEVTLKKVPQEVEKLVAVVTIHEADRRKQTFGKVKNAYIRLVNKESGDEICKFTLDEDSKNESAMIFGEIHRDGSEWVFKAIGQGVKGGLRKLCANYGIDVD